jgi:hydroxymethylglutaryl-CoA reductase
MRGLQSATTTPKEIINIVKKMEIIAGFSKLSKIDKIKWLASQIGDEHLVAEMQSFWHSNPKVQKHFDEFSENTLTNYYLPFGVAPNVLINGQLYAVPMVIEESSVVAAAAKSAKFWADRGGFHAEILGTKKIGQVHFIWEGDYNKLYVLFDELKEKFLDATALLTKNMRARGGGITAIELVNQTHLEPNYYQFKATFETCDSMGANFINSCLEAFAKTFLEWAANQELFTPAEQHPTIIMSILSNYTPECMVRAWVTCNIPALGEVEGFAPEVFAQRFQKAVAIAEKDPFRATTHNKGIFNGIDAVVLATGNDFRAVEACGHTYASRSGKYSSLSHVSLENNQFKFWLDLPIALGVVGGLTALHPLAKRSLELLGNPSAQELMKICAVIGLAQNFGAVKSLTTTGIQKGHMKMHLLNILRTFRATEAEQLKAVEYFKTNVVSYAAVQTLLDSLREKVNKE